MWALGYQVVTVGHTSAQTQDPQGYRLVNQFGSQGTNDGQFRGLNDVISTGDFVFVPDYENHRIQKFTSDGTFVKSWGTKGTEVGQLNKPHSMVFDSEGNLYVTDMNNYRIQKFDNNGTFLAMWGSQGTGDSQFLHPHGIGIDSSDNVFVTDAELLNVQKFTSDGKFVTK